MELKGKKMLFLGDSITEGVGTSDIKNVYWMKFSQNDGSIVYGYGISGTRIAKQKKPYDPVCPQYFVTRVDSMEKDADVVVVFGGTNDFGHGDAAMGNMSDRTPDTFYGALHNLYITLMEKYKDAQIVVMTPLHRTNENMEYNYNGLRNVASLSGYADAIKEVAAYYAIPVLDLYTVSGIQPEIDSNREKYMPDGLHPSDAGNEVIYRKLKEFIKAL